MAAWFGRIASHVATISGHFQVFLIALGIVVIWAVAGPFFAFSDTWQLVINTGTTIVTFLMVFLIQNTQNRDARAMHIKLDEIIRSIGDADNAIIQAEDETDEQLADLKRQYEALCEEHATLRSEHLSLKERIGATAGDLAPRHDAISST